MKEFVLRLSLVEACNPADAMREIDKVLSDGGYGYTKSLWQLTLSLMPQREEA